jgi:hypothetical protein
MFSSKNIVFALYLTLTLAAAKLTGKSVHSILDPRAERRAILGHTSGLETPLN